MARKRLHQDDSAEREAIDVGKKFMNSSDVVGDMSRQYGADLSSVRIHHDADSAARVQQRGVDAFSTGTDVFFGRGAFDQSDPASRGLLAHELSHSLQQGVGGGQSSMTQSAPMGAEQGGLISWFKRKIAAHRAKKQAKKAGAQGPLPMYQQEPRHAFKDIDKVMKEPAAQVNKWKVRDGMENLGDYLTDRLGTDGDGKNLLTTFGNVHNIYYAANNQDKERGSNIGGLNVSRAWPMFRGDLSEGMSQEDVGDMFEKIMAAGDVKRGTNLSERFTQDEIDNKDQSYVDGMRQYKGLMFRHLKKLEGKYGTMGTQMHPRDFIMRLGDDWVDDMAPLQDISQVARSKDRRIFDPANNEEDAEYERLIDYYDTMYQQLNIYSTNTEKLYEGQDFEFDSNNFEQTRGFMDEQDATGRRLQKQIGGPRMSPKEERKYLRNLRKRMKKEKAQNQLYGHFLK